MYLKEASEKANQNVSLNKILLRRSSAVKKAHYEKYKATTTVTVILILCAHDTCIVYACGSYTNVTADGENTTKWVEGSGAHPKKI